MCVMLFAVMIWRILEPFAHQVKNVWLHQICCKIASELYCSESADWELLDKCELSASSRVSKIRHHPYNVEFSKTFIRWSDLCPLRLAMQNLRETLLCRGLEKPSLSHDTLSESDSIESPQLPSNSLVQAPLSNIAMIRIQRISPWKVETRAVWQTSG